MDDSILDRIPRLSDDELAAYVRNPRSYRLEVVESAARELARRGKPVSEEQLRAIRSNLAERDTGTPSPESLTAEDRRRAAARSRRLRTAAWIVLILGLAAAVLIFLRAAPDQPNPTGDMMDQKRAVRELQQFGGTFNALLVQALDGFDSLFQGRALAGTVAVLSLAAAAVLGRLGRSGRD